MRIKDYLYMPLIYLKWRNANKHNRTILHSRVDINHITVGNGTYGGINVLADGNVANLRIGDYCSIGPEVLFVLESEHNYNRISTYPFKTMFIQKTNDEATSKGDIVVEDDVWIGTRATIMSGVHIGRGAVIGACSCVTKDVPAYSIVGGVPARVIKKRFSDDIIEKLLKIQFDKIDKKYIHTHIERLSNRIESINDLDFIDKEKKVEI